MDLFHHAPDALLRRSHAYVGLARRPFVHPPERVTQEVELTFRDLADPCFLLVDRQLQSGHDLAHALQSFLRLAASAQDHQIIRIGHDARAEAALQPTPLPFQHEPAHIQICQQW